MNRKRRIRKLRIPLGMGLAVGTSVLVASLFLGRGVAAKPPTAAAHVPRDTADVVHPASAATTRTVTEGGVSWNVVRQDSPDGPCISVVASVEGVEQGRLGGVCGTPDDSLLEWAIGGIEVGNQWFNVADGVVPSTASSVSVTLGDGAVRTDEGVAEAGGVWIVVFPGDPMSQASDVVRISVLGPTGSLITQKDPPSIVAYRRAEQAGSAGGGA